MGNYGCPHGGRLGKSYVTEKYPAITFGMYPRYSGSAWERASSAPGKHPKQLLVAPWQGARGHRREVQQQVEARKLLLIKGMWRVLRYQRQT